MCTASSTHFPYMQCTLSGQSVHAMLARAVYKRGARNQHPHAFRHMQASTHVYKLAHLLKHTHTCTHDIYKLPEGYKKLLTWLPRAVAIRIAAMVHTRRCHSLAERKDLPVGAFELHGARLELLSADKVRKAPATIRSRLEPLGFLYVALQNPAPFNLQERVCREDVTNGTKTWMILRSLLLQAFLENVCQCAHILTKTHSKQGAEGLRSSPELTGHA